MKSVLILTCILIHVADAYHFRKNEQKREMSITPQVAPRLVETGSTVENKKCEKKGSTKGFSEDAIDCCFIKEGERQKGNLWTNVVGPVISIIPGVDDEKLQKLGKSGAKAVTFAANALATGLETAATTWNAAEDIDADDCVEKGLRANLKGIKKIQRQVEKLSQKVGESIREVKKAQKQLAKVERDVLDRTSIIIKSANALAAKLDQLNLRVIENGQRLAQSTFYQVSIKLQSGIAGVNTAFNTVMELTAERNRYKERLGQLLGDLKSAKGKLTTEGEKRKQELMDEWKSFKIVQAHALLNAWALVQTSFGTVSAVFTEGNFFDLYMNQLVQNEVSIFLGGLRGLEKECAKVFERENINALIKQIHRTLSVDDPTIRSVGLTIIRAVGISQLGAKGISANDDFLNNVNSVISSLDKFRADLSSKKPGGAFSVIVMKVLAAVLPTVCPPDPVCRAAAVQAGYPQTDDMLVWRTAATAKSEEELPTVTIANNPACLLANEDCPASVFLCTPIPKTKVARDLINNPKNPMSIKTFWETIDKNNYKTIDPNENENRNNDMSHFGQGFGGAPERSPNSRGRPFKIFTISCGEKWFVQGEEEICQHYVKFKPEYIKKGVTQISGEDGKGGSKTWCVEPLDDKKYYRPSTKNIAVALAQKPADPKQTTKEKFPQHTIHGYGYMHGLATDCGSVSNGWCNRPIYSDPVHKLDWVCVYREWQRLADLGHVPCKFLPSAQKPAVSLTRRNLLKPDDKLSSFVVALRKAFNKVFDITT